MILHRHYLHSLRNEAKTPCNTVVLCQLYHTGISGTTPVKTAPWIFREAAYFYFIFLLFTVVLHAPYNGFVFLPFWMDL